MFILFEQKQAKRVLTALRFVHVRDENIFAWVKPQKKTAMRFKPCKLFRLIKLQMKIQLYFR